MADNHTPAQRSRNMRAVRNKNTAPELLVRSCLHRLGFRFRLHNRKLPGSPDIVLAGRKSVLFVHGCFWHGHDCKRGALPTSNVDFWGRKIAKNQDRDQKAYGELQGAGWKIMTVWQCETKNLAALEKRLLLFLKGRANA